MPASEPMPQARTMKRAASTPTQLGTHPLPPPSPRSVIRSPASSLTHLGLARLGSAALLFMLPGCTMDHGSGKGMGGAPPDSHDPSYSGGQSGYVGGQPGWTGGQGNAWQGPGSGATGGAAVGGQANVGGTGGLAPLDARVAWSCELLEKRQGRRDCQHLPPSAWETMNLYYDGYCASPPDNGWSSCLEVANPISPVELPEGCVEETAAYLECLASCEAGSCAQLRPSSRCDPAAPPPPLPADAYCSLSDSWAFERATDDDGSVVSYHHRFGSCRGGDDFELVCEPVDRACSINCQCLKNDEFVGDVTLRNVRSMEFEDLAWKVCGFPSQEDFEAR